MTVKFLHFARTAQKWAILPFFGWVGAIATADTHKLEQRLCVEVICESFDACEKCAQNVWGGGGGGHKCAKTPIFDKFGEQLSWQRQIPPNSNYECVSNSNVNCLRYVKVCTKCLGGHKCAKTPFFDKFWGVVTIATADIPKFELRMCAEVKCESFEACEKCAQNIWGGHKCAKTSIFDNFWG